MNKIMVRHNGNTTIQKKRECIRALVPRDGQ